MYLPSITYSFPVNSIKSKHLDQLQSETAALFLPKLGFNRTTATAIVYGPKSLGGIDLRILRHKQGLSKLEHLVKHWRNSTSEASQHFKIKIALSWLQYCAGTSTPILQEIHSCI